eukprot:2471042-Pleurochrysis_carterae.AAC.1
MQRPAMQRPAMQRPATRTSAGAPPCLSHVDVELLQRVVGLADAARAALRGVPVGLALAQRLSDTTSEARPTRRARRLALFVAPLTRARCHAAEALARVHSRADSDGTKTHAHTRRTSKITHSTWRSA